MRSFPTRANTRAFTLILLFAASFAVNGAPEIVNVYIWNDYIAPGVLARFEAETGIKPVVDLYDSNEMLEAKLLAGRSGYDVVFPTARPFAERQITAGIYRQLDRQQLTNAKNLDPRILTSLQDVDSGNAHLMPYTWGTTGLGLNREAVAKRLGPNAATDTWSLLFDPNNASKLADCGVAALDDPEEALHAALIYLGKDPNSAAAEDLNAVIAMFAKVRPHIRYFHSSQYISDLANGDICLAMGYSGDVLQARERANEAGRGAHVDYVIPKEGAIMWIDLMAVPNDAPHPTNALKFINFILRADVMAEISNFVSYANANTASTALLDEHIRNDPGIYPSDAVRAQLLSARNLSTSERRARTRTFQRMKTGR